MSASNPLFPADLSGTDLMVGFMVVFAILLVTAIVASALAGRDQDEGRHR